MNGFICDQPGEVPYDINGESDILCAECYFEVSIKKLVSLELIEIMRIGLNSPALHPGSYSRCRSVLDCLRALRLG